MDFNLLILKLNKKIYRLEISCDYKEFGCNQIVKLDALDAHLNECIYQSNKVIQCPKGCETLLERSQFSVSILNSYAYTTTLI